VAGILDVLLDIDGVVAEGGFRLRLRHPQDEESSDSSLTSRIPLPRPGGRLEHHREADLLRDAEDLRLRGDRVHGPRDDGDAGRLDRLPASVLEPIVRMA